jgi:glycerol-3-phosphate dehydrogenase
VLKLVPSHQTETSLLFIIPWGSHWIFSTTNTDWNLDLAHPAASQSDIDYLLGQGQQTAAGSADVKECGRALC